MPKAKPHLPELPPVRRVVVGDYTIAYFVTGPDDGQPLMLCHGLAANGLQFIEDAVFFGMQGFRVIVPDLRGHGRSTCPDVRTDSDFSFPRMAADMIAILNAEQIGAIDWVGNSLGGILALSLMGTNRGRIKKFISFGTAFSLDAPKMLVPLIQLSYKIMGPEILARLGAPMTCRNAVARAVIYAMLREMDIDAVIRIAGHVGNYDLIAEAMRFDGPMLMIRGARDKSVNHALKPTLAAMRERDNFRMLELADAGHCANLDQPERVRNIILDFLGR